MHQHSINITVDSMDVALQRMSRMQGLELSSNIDIARGQGTSWRIVDSRYLNDTLDAIKEMGDVTHSESFATNVFSNWAWLQAEIRVRSHEYDRLMELLHEASTMQDFNYIERRLRHVISQLEGLRGQLNNLDFEMGSARIFITLSAAEIIEETVYEPVEELPERSRLQQIGDAFALSVNSVQVISQALLLTVIYISLPLAIMVAVCMVILRFVRRKRKALVQNISTKELLNIKEDENNEEK